MRKFLTLATLILALVAFMIATHNSSSAAVVQSKGKSGIAATYATQCAKCHRENGKGIDSLKPPDFTSADWQKSVTDKKIADTIRNGVGIMPGYKSTFSAAQIAQMVKYIRAFGPKAAKK